MSFNEKLMTLSMPALASVNTRGDVAPSDLKITDNALKTCEAKAIHDQLVARGFSGQADISGVDGSCSP